MKKIELYLRENISSWIKYSIKICNSKCLITGKSFEVVHHKYPFHKIITETFEELNIKREQYEENYSKEELKLIKKKCLELHFKYGAGACLTKELHKEFHSLYGNDVGIQDFEKYMYRKINNLSLRKTYKKNKRTTNYIGYKDMNVEKFIGDEEFIVNQKNMLLNNIKILENKKYIKEKHPLLYSYIKSSLNLLIKLHYVTINQLESYKIDYNDKNLLFISYSDAAKLININSGKSINIKINCFVLFYLLNKIKINSSIKSIYSKKSNKITKIPSNFYSIPIYNEKLLMEAEAIAKLIKQKEISLSSWSKELIVNAFENDNKEIISRIYPDINIDEIKNKKDNYKYKLVISEINKVIDSQGYIMQQEIVDIFVNCKLCTKIHGRVYVERYLQTIEKYGLKRIRTNKQIKNKYKMDTDGYPFIVVKNK